MADNINTKKPADGMTTPGSVATKLQTSREYLDQLKKLSEDEALARGVPDDTRQTLKDAISGAEDLYKRKASQNEWLDVAQTLGQAATQFGAAQAGMRSGRDMSGLPLNKGVDYNARTDQAFRDYQQSIRNAGENAAIDRDQFQEGAKSRESDFSKQHGYLSEALKASMAHEHDQELEKKLGAAEKERADRESRRDSDAILRMNVKELDTEEKSLADKLRAAQNVSNAYSQMGDADKKNLDKLNMALGPEASKADINLASLRSDMDSKTKPGLLNRMTGGVIPTTTEDTAAQQGVLDSKVSDIRNQLDVIRARKQEMLRGPKSTGPASAPPSSGGGVRKEASPPPSDPANVFTAEQLTTYATQYNMSEDQARKYLESQGYKFSGK